MRCTTLLTAAFTATAVLLPPAVVAQDCSGAIAAVDQKLQTSQHRDDWNRIQVRLYIAEQFLAENEPEKCLDAVQEAQTIAGLQAAPAAGQQEDGTEEAGDAKDTSPGGANIQGQDAEGWGTNEADPGAVPQEQ